MLGPSNLLTEEEISEEIILSGLTKIIRLYKISKEGKVSPIFLKENY